MAVTGTTVLWNLQFPHASPCGGWPRAERRSCHEQGIAKGMPYYRPSPTGRIVSWPVSGVYSWFIEYDTNVPIDERH